MDANIDFKELFLLCGMSFGAHFSKSAVTIVGTLLIMRETITPLGYGYLTSASSLPAILIPLLSGYYLDRSRETGGKQALGYLVIVALGPLLLAIAVANNSFLVALFSQILFGLGSSSLNTAQRTSIASSFRHEMVFAFGCVMAVSNLSKTLGKLSATYITTTFSVSWFFVVNETVCFASFLCGLLIWRCYSSKPYEVNQDGEDNIADNLAENEDDIEGMIEVVGNNAVDISESKSESKSGSHNSKNGNVGFSALNEKSSSSNENLIHTRTQESFRLTTRVPSSSKTAKYHSIDSATNSTTPVSTSVSTYCSSVSALGGLFWFYLFIHATYLSVFHLLANFLPHILVNHSGVSVQTAGYTTALMSLSTIFLAAPLGAIVDSNNIVHKSCLISAMLAILAYLMLLLSPALSPVWSILLFSLAQVLLPTITLVLAMEHVEAASFGLALGIVESIDSTVSALGNVLFGLVFAYSGSYTMGLTFLLLLAIVGLFSLILGEYWSRQQRQQHQQHQQVQQQQHQQPYQRL